MQHNKIYNIKQKNPKHKYEGSHYAITGSGGFEINTKSKIILKSLSQFGKYDLTNAIQLLLDKNIFNNRLGEFNEITNRFSEDSITIEITNFIFNEETIISLGSLETVYYDFKKYIYDYFQMNYSIDIFNEKNIGIFDRSEFYKIINEKKVTGNIVFNDIHNILNTLIERNICGNRENNEIKEGFIESDLFFIQNGFEILLEVDCGLTQLYKYDLCIKLQ